MIVSWADAPKFYKFPCGSLS